MKKTPLVRSILTLSSLLACFSCVKYQEGLPTTSSNVAQIPEITFQSKVFFINPPITAKIGESNDDDSIRARAAGSKELSCATYDNYTWKPNSVTLPAQPIHKLPKDLDSDQDAKAAHKKQVKNEFTLDASDVSMYENDPNPLEVIESLNIFSEDILPRKITGDSTLGLTPQMLLAYAKYLNDGSDVKITSVASIKKISGSFYGDHPNLLKNSECSANVIEGIQYGAALSVSIIITFQNESDRQSFQTEFGDDKPFSDTSSTKVDTDMTNRLTAMKAKIEMAFAEVGGDFEKTKSFVAKNLCRIDQLDECRKMRRSTFKYFFEQELQPPQSPNQTNGWMPASLEVGAIPVKK